MNKALELADDCDMHAKHADNSIAFEVMHNAAAILRSQHAEIEGWKKGQKENLRNQCDLHAEIERLKTVPMKYRRMTFNAELQNEVTALHAERERNLDSICVGNNIINSLKSENGELYAEVDALKAVLSALRAENQKLRDALGAIILNFDAGNITLGAIQDARAALAKMIRQLKEKL